MSRWRLVALVLVGAALGSSCTGRLLGSAGPAPAAKAGPGTSARGAGSTVGASPGTSVTPPPVMSRGAPQGLTGTTAFVTIVRGGPTRLRGGDADRALDAVWRVLGVVPALAPQPDGARLLANLRMNEYLMDVTIWRPEVLDVAGRRVTGVSGVVIPFTGSWQRRVLIVREGAVEASPALNDSPDLALLEQLVEGAGSHS